MLPRILRYLYRFCGLGREVAALKAQVETLRGDLRRLSELHDYMKCRYEVARDWIDEFQAWKAASPLDTEPLVSVCVSTYNRGELLTQRCIPSVLAQTYNRFELIVVGDGCTDSTEQRLTQIRDPRLVFVNLPARGRYPVDQDLNWLVAGTSAINHALRLSRGDFVTHLDDDDEYLPKRLEALVSLAVAEKCDFIWHPFWAQGPTGEWFWNEARELAMGQVTTSSVFYRSWLKRIGWDPDAYLLREPGDWNCFRKIRYLGTLCKRHPETLLRHYQERNRAAA